MTNTDLEPSKFGNHSIVTSDSGRVLYLDEYRSLTLSRWTNSPIYFFRFRFSIAPSTTPIGSEIQAARFHFDLWTTGDRMGLPIFICFES